MKGLKYQLKNIQHDKMCILTFLLPIIVGIVISFISDSTFSTISQNTFGVVEDAVSQEFKDWLEGMGKVTMFKNEAELKSAVLEPSTQMIGVFQKGGGLKTILAGDELELNRIIADSLPVLFENRKAVSDIKITVMQKAGKNDGLKRLLIVITMVTAMFMGCTFNAMNMISEKEDGITFIKDVMPITDREYIVQKTLLGLLGGIISTAATALACVRIEYKYILPLLAVIILATFIAALIGMFIGRYSGGLMVGIVYIKVIMILFIAPPILFYLTVSKGGILHTMSYILPSSAAFYSMMDLIGGEAHSIGKNLLILLGHCIIWTVVFQKLNKRNGYE